MVPKRLGTAALEYNPRQFIFTSVDFRERSFKQHGLQLLVIHGATQEAENEAPSIKTISIGWENHIHIKQLVMQEVIAWDQIYG